MTDTERDRLEDWPAESALSSSSSSSMSMSSSNIFKAWRLAPIPLFNNGILFHCRALFFSLSPLRCTHWRFPLESRRCTQSPDRGSLYYYYLPTIPQVAVASTRASKLIHISPYGRWQWPPYGGDILRIPISIRISWPVWCMATSYSDREP